MEDTWSELGILLRQSPTDSRLRRLMERVIASSLAILNRGTRAELQSFARRCDRSVRTLAPSRDADAAAHRYWYAGQLHMLAALTRTALSDGLSHETMRLVRTRAHWAHILRALEQREVHQAQLATELQLDASQLGKTLDEMETRALVQSEKIGQYRYVRLTLLGARAASADLGARPAIEQASDEPHFTISTARAETLIAAAREVIDSITPAAVQIDKLAKELQAVVQSEVAVPKPAAPAETSDDVTAVAYES